MIRAFLKTAVLLFVLAGSAAAAEHESVARVALSAGEAFRVNSLGVSEPLRLGNPLNTGDRIITGKGAIAILVFSDGGRVSLRPDTELVIRRYSVDPSGPGTRLELELVRGVMRQISGDAARLQPERYRLNTPVAAIGVRGTDFLAKISGGIMETFVQEGVIVVLPGGGVCADVSAGCRPIAVLTASDAGQYMRVLSSGSVERRAVNPEDLDSLFGVKLTGVGSASNNSVAPGLVFVVGAGADAFKRLNGRDGWQGNSSDLTSDRVAQVAADAAYPLPENTGLPPPALPTQLVWGRFSNAEEIPAGLLLPYADASQGRHVTVGELGRYALWRADPLDRLDPSLRGVTQFSLAASGAVFAQASGMSPAWVHQASLSVDFDKSTFGAGVTVASAQTGAVSFGVSGRVNDEGVFWAGNASQRIAGALSLDGKEAGYLFTKEHSLGTFRGVTLWNAR